MKKILGILGLLVVICVVTASFEPKFLGPYNITNTLKWSSLYGILGIGVAFVIITGGIDLSIGSLVGLVGCLLPTLMVKGGLPAGLAVPAVLLLSLGIGVLHGLLITKLHLQPFVVTLCGLMFYRGYARYLTNDQNPSFGAGHDVLKYLATGKPFSIPMGGAGPVLIPMPFLILVVLAILASILLNRTIYGRYLLALGRNEQAARYSGIRTDRMVIAAYAICSLLAGIGGVLFSLEVSAIQPAGHGNFYELYAIAAAVLGGCSLRGGEGAILGVVIGAAVIQVLRNAINILGIPDQLEFAIIGAVILLGVIADELVKRYAARRRAARSG